MKFFNSSNVVIRQAAQEDALNIAKIHVASWQAVYHGKISDEFLQAMTVKDYEKKWQERLKLSSKNQQQILVLVIDDQLKGFASFGPPRDDVNVDKNTHAEIYAIYLDPSIWRKGYGKLLLNKALTLIQSSGFDVFLWVLDNNDSAREFYKAMKFLQSKDTKTVEIGGRAVQELKFEKSLNCSFDDDENNEHKVVKKY